MLKNILIQQKAAKFRTDLPPPVFRLRTPLSHPLNNKLSTNTQSKNQLKIRNKPAPANVPEV